jgi:hypothetical protein
LPDVSPHGGGVGLDVPGQHWLGWQDRVQLVGLHNDNVDHVKPSKIVPHVFGLLHGEVSQAVQNPFIVGFDGELSLEERPNDGPCSAVPCDVF